MSQPDQLDRRGMGRVGGLPMPLLVLLLGSITAIGPLTIDLYLPAFPALADSLDTTESMVHFTLTACLVGLAIGQAIAGPLSDALGRRRPLLVGIFAYTVASVLCALAPTAELLTAARFLQGLTGAAGLVIAQALVRDLVEGRMVARVLSRLVLVMGVAPVLAPTIGGQLLHVTGWRGLFWALTGFGAFMIVIITLFIRETLPPQRRRTGGTVAALRSYRRVMSDGGFVAHVAMGGLGFVMIFGYVSGAPFAYQVVHGVSPQMFGVLFGLNAVGMVIMSQVNARLVLTIEPFRILRVAVPITVISGIALVVTASTGLFGLPGLMAPLFFMMASIGLILPNNGAMALNRHPGSAGTAAALLGSGQFVVGAFAGPAIGAIESDSALPMAILMMTGATGMLVMSLILTRQRRAARLAEELADDIAASTPANQVVTSQAAGDRVRSGSVTAEAFEPTPERGSTR